MPSLVKPTMLAGLLLSAAIFGFFYAWVCSTMWGLDAAPPQVAIAAMQAMNASVRNGAFFPAFFLTPLVLGAAAYLLRKHGQTASARLFAAAAVIYLLFGLVLTMAINVPMNQALADQTIPQNPDDAATLWQAYSGPWQFWNQMRTLASGLSFALAAYGAVLYRAE